MITLKNKVNISPKFFETAMKKCHNSLTNYKKIQRLSAYSYHLPMQSDNNNNENNTLTLETVLFRKEKSKKYKIQFSNNLSNNY